MVHIVFDGRDTEEVETARLSQNIKEIVRGQSVYTARVDAEGIYIVQTTQITDYRLQKAALPMINWYKGNKLGNT